jgi:hypothetical protein
MITILVANIKGRSGKTTIATHRAAAFAGSGHSTGAEAGYRASAPDQTRGMSLSFIS